jgi:hypothetical protein
MAPKPSATQQEGSGLVRASDSPGLPAHKGDRRCPGQLTDHRFVCHLAAGDNRCHVYHRPRPR